jgi:phosphate-selective porin
MRPEIQHAERITLARPQANTQGILALEGAYNNGPLHFQTEIFGAQYRGKIDGYGAGAYFLAGWFLTGETRNYQPKWGILVPHTPLRSLSAEIFVRASHTRGDDDLNGWNDFKSLTLGGNLYYRKLRASLNLLHGKTRKAIDSQDDGLALNLRLQYFF